MNSEHKVKKNLKELPVIDKINSISLINANFNYGKTNILKILIIIF